MGWMKVIHGYTAYVFITAVMMRMIWMFTGNKYAHWDKFIPVHRVPAARLLADDQVLPVRAATSRRASSATTRWRRSTYTLVFGLYFAGHRHRPDDARRQRRRRLAVHWFGSLGAARSAASQMARWIHHVVMWLLLGFAVHHVYSARADVDGRGERHDRVDLLRLQVRAARAISSSPATASSTEGAGR